MATSGTISQTVFDTRKVIDHAFLRCKLPPQTITAERIEFARDALYLLLSDLPTKGVQLWTIDRQILPLYEGLSQLVTPTGTIDVLQANLRQLTRQTGADASTSTQLTTTFPAAVALTSAGILWSGATAPFVVESSPDGVAWTPRYTAAIAPLAAVGEWTWVDLSRVVAAQFWRVRATLGNLNDTEIFWGGNPAEIPVARLSRDAYDNLPNKAFPGRPLQYWLNRQADVPVMNLWPVPNASQAYNQITVRRTRHIMDVGTMQQTLEIPQRWFSTVVDLLAEVLSREMPEVDPMVAERNAMRANASLAAAQNAEYDASPIRLTPNIGVYTR